MATSTSANLGLTLPGSTVNDTRLGDMQAVKSSLITIDSAVANVAASNAKLGGDHGVDFNVKNLSPAGDIIPTGHKTQNIGGPNNRFKGIYVDEAHLSVNTLYLGDTAILGTNQDTVNIKADPGQSINIKTQGVGKTYVTSENGVELSTTNTGADVSVIASGVGAVVRMIANQSVELTGPTINLHGDSIVSGNQTVTGGLTVTGNLVVNGTTTQVNSATVTTKDNIIEVNKGQVGSGVSAGKAGLSVDRGDEPAYQMVFDETDDMFKVGMVGSLQTIASQNYVQAYSAPVSHTHLLATQTVDGLMSHTDKAKLDNAATAANTYTQAQVDTLIANAIAGLQSHLYSYS